MLFTSGPFRPGIVTDAQAAELNRLFAKVGALDRIATIPPVTIQRGPGGQPMIGLAGEVGGGDGTSITPNSDSITITERTYACVAGSLVETATTYTITVAIDAEGVITVTKV
jgi:hypothetical protein